MKTNVKSTLKELYNLRAAGSEHQYLEARERAVVLYEKFYRTSQNLEVLEFLMQTYLNTVRGLFTFREFSNIPLEEHKLARDLAIKIFSNSNCKSSLMYELMIIAHARCRDSLACKNLYENLLKEPFNRSDIQQVASSFVRCCCLLLDDPNTALKIVNELRPEERVAFQYNQILDYYVRESNFDRVNEVYEEMLTSGVIPDPATRSILARAFGGTQKGFQMLLNLGLMEDSGRLVQSNDVFQLDLHNFNANEARIAVLTAIETTFDKDLLFITGKGKKILNKTVTSLLEKKQIKFQFPERNHNLVFVSRVELQDFASRQVTTEFLVNSKRLIGIRVIALFAPILGFTWVIPNIFEHFSN